MPDPHNFLTLLIKRIYGFFYFSTSLGELPMWLHFRWICQNGLPLATRTRSDAILSGDLGSATRRLWQSRRWPVGRSGFAVGSGERSGWVVRIGKATDACSVSARDGVPIIQPTWRNINGNKDLSRNPNQFRIFSRHGASFSQTIRNDRTRRPCRRNRGCACARPLCWWRDINLGDWRTRPRNCCAHRRRLLRKTGLFQVRRW